MKTFFFTLLLILLYSCNKQNNKIDRAIKTKDSNETFLVILGTVQDAGSPHIACKKDCCKSLWGKDNIDRQVVSLGLIDFENNLKFIFEATPDFPTQTKKLKSYLPNDTRETPNGIFLTHAHIGHYTGLMYLGKEAMNAKGILVYAMPKMLDYLSNNGPWSQLVSTNNILLSPIFNEQKVILSNNLKVIPFIVPHRDEYSETVGFKIIGPNKSAIFIPDIDKWEKWDKSIIEEISKVDYAFLDATFYDGEELNNRDISQIPHPFVVESMEKFKNLSSNEKSKIYFIHLNHTNPLLNKESKQYETVIKNGYKIASINDKFNL